MTHAAPIEWLRPTTLDEALAVLAERGEDVTVLAGGTFVGVLVNQGFLAPTALLDLAAVEGLDGIGTDAAGELVLGPMVRHRAMERSAVVREGWPVLARAFELVASARVRNVATVGGVLADADYASDPPAVLVALGARAVLASAGGVREVAVEDLILGHYETCLEPDELIVGVRVPPAPARCVYRKFRSRSSEDRPCLTVAAAHGESGLRVVVGAISGRPQQFPDVCALAADGLGPETTARIADGYAERVEAISDARGSAAYRRRLARVEVRRALEAIAS